VKILYIDHPEPDQLSALVYMGLVQELGAENVVDWPWKHTFHGQVYEGPIPYDPPGSRGTAAPFPWMIPSPGRIWNDEEVFDRVNEFDLTVLAAPRAYSIRDLSRLINRTGHPRRLVMTDGEDYTTVRWDVVERFRPSVYFKLSLVESPLEFYLDSKARVAHTVRVVPFPQAAPLPSPAPVPKDLDVVFYGGGNWQPHRRENVQPTEPSQRPVLEAKLRAEFPAFAGGHNLGHDEYMATLNRAKVAVCVGGSGIEPLRTYEILSCPGTLLAREKIPVISPYPLVDGVNHVAFDGTSMDDIVRVVRQALEDEPRRERIAAEGNRLLQEHYTPQARAKQLLEESFR
jgi:Glycosyl transferases group 1